MPKVGLAVGDRPMVTWVIEACVETGVDRCVVVVGFGAQHVRAALAEYDCCEFVEQKELLGTAHATQAACACLGNSPPGDVFVLAGDGPLIRSHTLHRLLRQHRDDNAAVTLATATLDDPTGYGRIVRDAEDRYGRIVEQKDANPEELLIHEVNPSYYCFRGDRLFKSLGKVERNNKQGEYYLTDVPAVIQAEGDRVSLMPDVPPEDVLSINTPEHLQVVDAVLRRRLAATEHVTP